MELINTKLRQQQKQHQQEATFLSENYMKPADMPFEVIPSSSKATITNYLQEFDHHHQYNLDHDHHRFMNHHPIATIQTPSFESLDHLAFPYNYTSSSTNFDNQLYECKPFADHHFPNNNSGHGQVMDNFQSGGYLNHHHHPIDIMGPDMQMQLDHFQEMNDNKPVNFLVPDEISCTVSADNNGYYRKKASVNVNMNMNINTNKNNNRAYPSVRKTIKVGKKSNVVKGQWTNEEDRLLIRLVDQYGIRKWSHIAQMLPGRIGKQCRERWHNHLRPDIKKDTWSEEEDKALIEAHAEIGNKWAEIAKRLPGRTENSIKNHWNATKRRQFSKRKCRSKYPRATLLQDYIKSLNLDNNKTTPTAATSSSSSKNNHRIKNSSFNNNNNNASNSRAATNKSSSSSSNHTLAAADGEFCPSDHLVPDFDFNEVPDFDFDDKLFDENCSIDSLIEEMPCTDHHGKTLDMPDFQVKKELDLVEMISQANL